MRVNEYDLANIVIKVGLKVGVVDRSIDEIVIFTVRNFPVGPICWPFYGFLGFFRSPKKNCE